MHDINNYTHEHELDEHDFLGCCKDCQSSVDIIKPHIMAFAARIKRYTREMLASLSPEDLYRLYQILDDLAHMEAGVHLAGLILKAIRREFPVVRSYYSTFFDIHEVHLAEELLKSDAPWETLKSFPLYPRYEALVRNQIDAMHIAPDSHTGLYRMRPCAYKPDSHEPSVQHTFCRSGQLCRNRRTVKKGDPMPGAGKRDRNYPRG